MSHQDWPRTGTAAILAGGQSRRLGGVDKALLALDGQRIIDRQIAVLRTVTDRVAIVAGDGERYRSVDAPVWHDLAPGAGPLGGIYTALVHALTPQVLVVACDLPFLQAAFLRFLVDCAQGADAAVPRTADGYQPLCASYARWCADRIPPRIDAHRLDVVGLLDELRVREIGPDEIAPYDPDGTLFFNVNTPEDYARSLQLVERRRS